MVVVASGMHSTADSYGDAPEECQVLSGTFGILVQCALFGLSAGTLLLKWSLETPRRRFPIFLLDSSKQIVGAGVIHVLNLVCAMIFSAHEAAQAGECAWYWVNIMIDTTFGVLLCYVLLKATEKLFGYETGHYGKGAQTGIKWEDNPDYTKWAMQIMVWSMIVSTMKLVVVVVMAVGAPFWEWLAVKCTHWIKDRRTRLVFVMIITPTCMNMFQFCVTDSFLKFQKMRANAKDVKKEDFPSEDKHELAQPLINESRL
mmetsp:Transcript_49605/g.91532  ORF Transcript_49605/g.91532 Transcript_49605/m.91532 type:complete len:258 (+) Transcript_49605:102-875(+)